MAAIAPKGSLPCGWVVKTSKKYPDRVYYFNLISGASTWECPELDPPRLLTEEEQFQSKHTSILNRSSEEPAEVKSSIDSRFSTPKNLLLASEKLMKTMENNLTRSKVLAGKLSLPLEKSMRTSESSLLDSTIGASRKSLPFPQKSPLIPLSGKRPNYSPKTQVKGSLLPSSVQSKNSASLTPMSQKRKLKDTEQQIADTNPPTAVVAPVVLEKKASTCSSSLPADCKKVKFLCKNKRVQMLKQNALNKKIQRKEMKQSLKVQEKLCPGSTLSNKSFSAALKERFGVSDKKVKVQSSQNSTSASSSESYDTDLDLIPSLPSTGVASSSMLSEIQNNSCEDIEMLDVSADLTKIDDLAVPAQITDSHCSYYIVIDTNVLIDDLNCMDEMKDTPINGCGPPHIFIPWIVIQELDALKRSGKTAGTIRAAQHAVRYLNKVLKSKHPRFHGQSPQEAEDCAKSYSKCNDDKILECCMSLAQKMPPEKVVLITHDKNLINKALICNIVVHSWASLKKLAKSEVIVKDSGKSKKKKKKKSPQLSPERMLQINQKNVDNKQDVCRAEIDTIMSEARQLLKDVLESFLIEEMNEAYGDPWNAFPINRQLLKGILDAISKYWRTVFAFHFAEKDKRNFELLREKVSRPEGFLGDKEDCISTLTAIEDVFYRIKRRWPQLEIPSKKVEDLRLKCLDTFNRHNSVNVVISQAESTKKLSEPESVLQAFENAWTVINHLCGMFMDFYQIQHNFVYEKPQIMPSEADFRNLMINLYPCVQNIKKLMSGVVGAIKNHNPRSQIFVDLYKALTELVPTLQIQANNPSVPNFNAVALERFCRDPENTERVQLGFKQIEHFFSKLDVAVKVMASFKTDRCPDSMALD